MPAPITPTRFASLAGIVSHSILQRAEECYFRPSVPLAHNELDCVNASSSRERSK